jgi:hypothetical protein
MTRVFVPENWNVQGRHVTSPIMATASWAVADGTPKPSWACENRINSVHGEITLCEFMVPIYRVWVDLDGNDLLVFFYICHRGINSTYTLFLFKSRSRKSSHGVMMFL